MHAMIKGLHKAGHDVKVIAMNTNKYHVEPGDLPEEFLEMSKIEYVDIDLSVTPVKALANLFSKRSLHVSRFESEAFKQKIKEVLRKERFDIIQLELLYMTPYLDVIRQYSDAPVVLRSHNIEYRIWERITANTRNPLKRYYLNMLTKRLKKYETVTMHLFDGIIPISKVDANFYLEHGFNKPVKDISFVIDLSQYRPHKNDDFPSLFHLGVMNWMPNEEGIQWFLDHVWPKVHAMFPTLKLYLAGRSMPAWLSELDMANVEVVGEVEDAQEFMLSKSVMIVPLFSGSGIRIKIIEGMALSKAIISTTIGAEGINHTHGSDILIADTPQEFIEAIATCVNNRSLCLKMGTNARALIEQDFNYGRLIGRLEAFYREVMKN